MIPRFVRTLGVMLSLLSTAFVVGQDSSVVTDDLQIAHTSTVPVNRGERVRLFARHYHSENSDQGAVIVLSSDILPADVGLGLDYQDYNLLEHLAGLGFDVFAADVTGYGLSPKPQMSDGCNAAGDVQPLLMPYPLYIPCEPTYTQFLTSLASDWDELDSIVEHVRDLTGDEQVALMGWSLGAARAAGYAARNPEAVERLVLVAPHYLPEAPDQVPAQHPAGQPLQVHEVDALVDEWEQAVLCEEWAEFEGVGVQLREEINEFDPLAAGWGYELGNLFRSPGTVGLAGFGRNVVQQISTPTLVLIGLDDSRATEGQGLYEDLAVDDKLRVDIECGSNWLVWEYSNRAIRDAASEFLQSGTVDGQASGELMVDREGEFE